ncbi:MAG: VWA domain-containing protein [Acidobacteriota bacterium]
MKRISSFFLFFSLLASCAVLLQAQTRPRRIGQTRQPPASGAASNPSPTRPTGPPVLGGANRSPGSQSSDQQTGPTGPEEVGAGDVIKVNTTLVTLPVSVMDRDGRYIPNLRKEDFRLWEEGLEQDVAFFAAVDKPFSVVLMIDTSGSTRFRLQDIQDAAITFVNQLRRDDRVMVVSFDDDVRVLSEFTSDRRRLADAIRQTETGNGTKLYDAVDLVINRKLSQVSGRKAIVLFTDGVDTTSRYASYSSNVTDAEELDALVYPVQYDTFTDMGGIGSGQPGAGGSAGTVIDIFDQIFGGVNRRRNRRGGGQGTGRGRGDYETANRYLQEMAERTGARTYQADSTQNIAFAFSKIAEELRRQYSLGYYPKNPAQAGQRRQIRVRVNQPNLAVKTRDSYVFNPSNSAQTENTAQKSAPVLRRDFAESGDAPGKKLK